MMKKILLLTSVFAALSFSIASCDLDLRPPGTLDPDNALQSPGDASRLRDGLYIAFRGRVGGSFAYLDEIRSDLFHASSGYGNNGGSMYNWIFTAADGSVQGLWSSCYYAIANANYFIEKAESVNTDDWSDEERSNLRLWIGEAYFIRAYYHLELAEAFCLNYVGNETSYGIPYVTVYNPTSDQSLYPSRGTLEETYTNILEDLDRAADRIDLPGAVGSEYLTADCVTALRARIALQMGDYNRVIELLTPAFLNKYPLVNTAENFESMWVDDSGSECILQLFASYPTELPSSYDFYYIGYNASQNNYTPYYFPEQWVVDLFNEYPQDLRTGLHLTQRDVATTGGASYNLYCFTKFPGNPDLRQNDANMNYAHKPKVFRIGEMYLILAEAYAGANQMGNAASTLNTLRQARIPGYTQDYPDGQVLSQIRNERVRELMGEGFRMQDLKRYGIGIERRAAQDAASIYLPSTNEDFHRDVTDYRFIFPIPQEEIDSNPNIAGQQNVGY